MGLVTGAFRLFQPPTAVTIPAADGPAGPVLKSEARPLPSITGQGWDSLLQDVNPNTRRQGLASEGHRLGRSDPASGLEKLGEIPGQKDRQDFAVALFAEWARHDPPAAAAALEALRAGELKAVAAAAIATAWAKSSPTRALEWASENLQGSSRQTALGAAAGEWARQSPSAAATWVSSQEGLPGADTMAAEIVSQWVEIDPSSASAWASAPVSYTHLTLPTKRIV